MPASATAQPCTSRPELGTVAGSVLDSITRLPLQEARVRVQWEQSERGPGRREVETDSAGRYMVCDVPAGTATSVLAGFMGREAGPIQLVAGSHDDATLRIIAPRARIDGRVLDGASGQPVPAAEVGLENGGPTRVSDEAGRFQMEVPPGRFALNVAHVAYTELRESLSVEFGTITNLTIRMSPNVIALDAIEVEVRSLALERAGFYERRERGQGTFITREDMGPTLRHQTSDILRTLPGIQMERSRFGMGQRVVGRGGCPFRYFLDGTPVGEGFQIDDVPAEWIEAIEVYKGTSTVPIQFVPPATEPNATCGIIAIWTRER